MLEWSATFLRGADLNSVDQLKQLVAHLRGPEGCPWDRAQTYDSLKALLLEEAYEVVDAVAARDFDGLEGELGDLLFLVAFYSRLAEDDGHFTLEGVAERVHRKLVRRHPHVFGERRARTPTEALASWNSVKEAERAEQAAPAGSPGAGEAAAPSLLDGIPANLPATLEAYELGVRAAENGFDWAKAADVLEKIEEEVGELKQALAAGGSADRRHLEEEAGDLLFTASHLARQLGSDPESCLRRANQKFARRFRELEAEVSRRGREVRECSVDELERIWSDVKGRE